MSIDNTSLTGSLCNDHLNVDDDDAKLWYADCGGFLPEFPCPCCTICCEDRTGHCEDTRFRWISDVDYYCARMVDQIESLTASTTTTIDSPKTGTHCECASDNLSLSCHYTEGCPTCNEDSTICGTVQSFGYTLLPFGALDSFHGTFQYHQAVGESSSPVTIDIEATYPRATATVSVNGQECSDTSLVECQDGYKSYAIDCSKGS